MQPWRCAHSCFEIDLRILWNIPFFGARTHLSAKTPNNRHVCFCCIEDLFCQPFWRMIDVCYRLHVAFFTENSKKGSVKHFFILQKSKRPSQVRKRECYDSESHSLFKEYLLNMFCFVLGIGYGNFLRRISNSYLFSLMNKNSNLVFLGSWNSVLFLSFWSLQRQLIIWIGCVQI